MRPPAVQYVVIRRAPFKWRHGPVEVRLVPDEAEFGRFHQRRARHPH